MKAVVQRVRMAEVLVDERVVGRIDRGLLVFAGLGRDDGPEDLVWMARKIVGLRVFGDVSAAAERSVAEVGGSVLAVSQFTLLADCRKGRRPSYDRALPAEAALPLFRRFVDELRTLVDRVETGSFGADMRVRLTNEGPFTLLLDSEASRTHAGVVD